jgi:hypothetical protein
MVLMQAVVVPMAKEAVLDGNVKNGYYVPNKYVRAQQDALVESLRLEGILGMLRHHPQISQWRSAKRFRT